MLRRGKLSSLAIGLILLVGTATAPAQTIAPDYDYQDYDRTKIDRYLDVEVWSGHSDGEYYEGENIVIHFRVNRDAFVAIYSIDTRNRVNLLFPSYEGEDNYVYGGVTYDLPGDQADYDLEVSGPEGFENLQIIASREAFEIPGWYNGPELIADTDDRDGYMDWVNANYFTRYAGQRFAYDRAVIYVNEWEEYYFRPVYYPSYPSWTMYGNVYIDYPWGSSVYINGVYWGVAPLYVPRIAIGWHTISIYDHYGYCWEHDFHVSRYNTAVFNKTIVHTSPTTVSKFKEVRQSAYRDPVKSGYPDFDSRKTSWEKTSRGKTGTTVSAVDFDSPPKKHVQGSTQLVKTERGYETDAATAVFPRKTTTRQGSTSRVRTGSRLSGESGSGKSGSSDGSYRQSTAGRSGGKSSISSGGSSSGRIKSSGGSSSDNLSSRRKTTGASRPKWGGSSGDAKVAPKTGSSDSKAVKPAPAKVEKKSSSDDSKQAKPAPAKVKAPSKSSSSSGKSSSSSGSSGGKSKSNTSPKKK
jgi:hypothetical protein